MSALTCSMKPYIQPFERQLALQELQALASGPIVPVDGDAATARVFAIAGENDAPILREALAYWQSIGDPASGLTAQLRGEATLALCGNGATAQDAMMPLLDPAPTKLPNRRCLRYATHGLHEYRGKFFPQLVGALMNIARLPSDAVVLDPMCGSGTTLVEARLSGRRSYGLDMNPLSVFVADVKCRALSLKPAALHSAFSTLQGTLNKPAREGGAIRRFAELAESDQTYLAPWFAPQTIKELDRIEAAIRQLPTKTVRAFYRVCLSNIVRGVSWQKNDDLRVRREATELPTGKTLARFLKEAARSTRTVAAFLDERRHSKIGRYAVREADARQAAGVLSNLVGEVDAIITSPPYATALPYIDTDRLSLIYLGLLPRESHRSRDASMIGNREITTGGRTELWSFFEAQKSLLPRKTRMLIQRIDRLNKTGAVGFRRKNLSALLAKYFFDMRETMRQAFLLLKPGGTMFLVVGNNRTTAGGRAVEIRTAEHLAAIAIDIGFQLEDDIAMDMLVSRDVFRKNAMRSEQILKLKKIR